MKLLYSFAAMLLLLCYVPFSRAQTLTINTPGVRFAQLDSIISLHVTTDTGEGGADDIHRFYEAFWGTRVIANDTDSTGYNMFDRYYKTLGAAIATRADVSCSSTGFTGVWTVFGPDSLHGTQNMGKIESVWADVGDPGHTADTNTIYAGSSGGLFKTMDGGKHWRCMTDNTQFPCGAMGINHIAVNPKNRNTIFIGTGMRDEEGITVDLEIGNVYKGYGAGILESFDSGHSWRQEFIPITHDYDDTDEEVQGVLSPR